MYTDLSGKRFGKLLVLKKLDKRQSNRVIWQCKCDCGNIHEATSTHLIEGITSSCGCKNLEDCVEGTRLRNLTRKRSDKKEKIKDSGVKGVNWLDKRQKWIASIGFKGIKIYLGLFKEDELELAIEARKKAEEKYFKPILEKYSRRD